MVTEMDKMYALKQLQFGYKNSLNIIVEMDIARTIKARAIHSEKSFLILVTSERSDRSSY